MSSLGWVVFLLSSLSIIVIIYLLYPWIETHLMGRLLNYIEWANDLAARMFLPIQKRSIILILTVTTLGMGVFGYLISAGYGLLTWIVTLLFLWIGWSALRLWLTLRWQHRLKQFDFQLVDGLNLLANSLKSGLNLNQAIAVLVEEMPNPLSQEFALVLSQEKLGLTIDAALEKLLERVPSDDLGVSIHAILILRETGGDLSETFDVIASTIRQRRKIDGKIQSMTAQGKTQAAILLLLPFAFLLFLYFFSPAYLMPLLTTQEGWMMLAAMLLMMGIGGLWMRKILRIEV